jgi:hypothetical protein
MESGCRRFVNAQCPCPSFIALLEPVLLCQKLGSDVANILNLFSVFEAKVQFQLN